MRTKYIGFVKTSFSSPSLPFRIGGYAPGENSQFPSFTHPPRTSTLRSRRIQKRMQSCIPKKPTRAQRETFFSSFPGLIRCPFPTIESDKGSCTQLCEKSDKKTGEKCSNSPVFSLFLSAFSENNATHRSVSRGGDTKPLRQQRKHARKRNCIRPTFHAKHTTARPVDAGFAHSRTPNLRVSPTLPPFRSCTKKQLSVFRWIAVLKNVGAEGFEPPTLCL